MADPPLIPAFKIGQAPIEAFNPKEILFRQLSIDMQNGEIFFRQYRPIHAPPAPSQINAYVKLAAENQIEVDRAAFAETPWDIPVVDQCYVVIQLDFAIENWRFSKKHFGLTTKGEYGGKYFFLRHIGPDGVIPPDDVTVPDKCRVVLFAVVQRDRNEPKHGVNFHIEVVYPAEEKSLEIIFDPDIPNPGGAGIPKHV